MTTIDTLNRTLAERAIEDAAPDSGQVVSIGRMEACARIYARFALEMFGG